MAEAVTVSLRIPRWRIRVARGVISVAPLFVRSAAVEEWLCERLVRFVVRGVRSVTRQGDRP